MLSIFLLYFIGKPFYTLAELHYKSRWLYAILGVVIFYVGIILGVVVISLTAEFSELFSISHLSDNALGLIGIPGGILTGAGFYYLLKKQWNKVADKGNSEDVLDAELLDNNN